jgi:hypothetical protein
MTGGALLVAIRYSEYLRKFYDKLKARKFLGIICRPLKNNRVFADFPNFVLAED